MLRRPTYTLRKHRSIARLLFAVSLGTLSSGSWALPAASQVEPVDPWTNVEEMIVVGDTALATLIEAPSSVIAFDAEELLSRGISDVGDLSEFTPNLEINSAFNASSPELFIRGVGLRDSNANAASAVAVISDGVYFNSPAGQLAQLFDVKNVSVLRGPQGSQYGRNASAGVILIESARPSGELGSQFNFTYGRFNQIDFEGYAETPIVPDLLSIRVAGKLSRRDPLGRNVCGGPPPVVSPEVRSGEQTLAKGFAVACEQSQLQLERQNDPNLPPGPENPGNSLPFTESRVNDRDNWAARAQLLFTPQENLRVLANFHGGQNRSLAPSFQHVGLLAPNGTTGVRRLYRANNDYWDNDRCSDPNGNQCLENVLGEDRGDPWSGAYSFTPKEDLDLFGTFVRVDWESDSWSLVSISSYEQNKRTAGLDIDASPFVNSERLVEDQAWQFLEDMRLTWSDPERLDLTLGLFFLHEKLEAESFFRGQSTGVLQQLGQDYRQTTDYLGIFGLSRFQFTERFSLEIGLRLNVERKDFSIIASNTTIRNDMEIPSSIPGLNILTGAEESFDVVPSGDVILEYQATEDVNFYTKFVRGYKGRHFNAGGTDKDTVISPAQPEFVNSFELGFSSTWLDGIFNWNGATFLYLYQDQQIFQLQSSLGGAFPINQLINAEDSRVYGVETDIRIQWQGASFFAAFGWLFTEYSDFRNEVVTIRPGAQGDPVREVRINDFSGNQLVNAPEFSLNGGISYDLEMARFGTLTPRFDFRFKDRVFTTPINSDQVGDNERWLFDMRVDYKEASGYFTLGFWVRNLTNEIYRSTTVGGRIDNRVVVGVADPRTYGITTTVKF